MKILYIGFNHRIKDPRLFYREMNSIIENKLDISIYYITTEEILLHNNIDNFNSIYKRKTYPSNSLIEKIKSKFFRIKNKIEFIKKVIHLNSDIVQASDAREIPFAIFLKILTKCKIIYDSHEDYYRQIVDYSDNKLLGKIKALPILIYELLFIRFFDIVFCTDDFLLLKYKEKKFGQKNINLLRNFPISNIKYKKNIFLETDKLDLLYIGSVNKYRGIIETINFLTKFNKKFNNKTLTLTLISPMNKLTKEFSKINSVTVYDYVDYDILIPSMKKYDVGICLWLDLPKFRRNLPLKNFDYMSVGLPIITSNFGNLKKYVTEANSAICISPTSYSEFEKAILKMFDPNTRFKLSNSGFKYVSEIASFNIESKNYINFIKEVNQNETNFKK